MAGRITQVLFRRASSAGHRDRPRCSTALPRRSSLNVPVAALKSPTRTSAALSALFSRWSFAESVWHAVVLKTPVVHGVHGALARRRRFLCREVVAPFSVTVPVDFESPLARESKFDAPPAAVKPFRARVSVSLSPTVPLPWRTTPPACEKLPEGRGAPR